MKPWDFWREQLSTSLVEHMILKFVEGPFVIQHIPVSWLHWCVMERSVIFPGKAVTVFLMFFIVIVEYTGISSPPLPAIRKDEIWLFHILLRPQLSVDHLIVFICRWRFVRETFHLLIFNKLAWKIVKVFLEFNIIAVKNQSGGSGMDSNVSAWEFVTAL